MMARRGWHSGSNVPGLLGGAVMVLAMASATRAAIASNPMRGADSGTTPALPALPAGSSGGAPMPAFPCFQRALLAQFTTEPSRFPGTSNPFRDVIAWGLLRDPTGGIHVMPAVCTGVSGTGSSAVYTFTLHYMPDRTGIWLLRLDYSFPSQPGVNPFRFSGFGQVAAFGVFADPAKPGPWRPAIPEGHPFAIARDRAAGSPEYVWSLTDLRLTLFAKGWATHAGGGWSQAAIDWARQHGFNRVRAALTAVFDRNRPGTAPFNPAAPNFSCFARPGPDWQPGSVDFERFDLEQWSVIESVCDHAASQDVQISVTTTFNSGCFDYEESYLGTSYASRIPVSPGPATLFGYRDELYFWYVVGRLAGHPNVQWCLFQEQDLADPAACPPILVYDAVSVRRWGELFRALNPYLAADVDARIVTVCPRRGTRYCTNGTTSWVLGPCSVYPVEAYRLCANNSEFLTALDDSWRSCIGLQRGVETGWASIAAAAAPAGESCPGGGAVAHRTALLAHGTPRPIFIEEDVIVRDTIDPGVAGSFRTSANPYAWCLCKNAAGTCTVFNTATAMPGIASNQDGLHKAWTDTAWSAGVLAQAYPTYTANGVDDLTESRASDAWKPLAAASDFVRRIPWWQLEPCTSGEISASLVLPSTWAHEWMPRGARIPGTSPRSIVAYRPYRSAAFPVQVRIAASELGGAGATVTWRYVHPVDRGVHDPPSGSYSAIVTNAVFWEVPEPPASMQGPWGEFVAVVNIGF